MAIGLPGNEPLSNHAEPSEPLVVRCAYFRAPIACTEVMKRTVREIGKDNCLELAAQLAFDFLMALFPALLFLVALIGYVPVENAFSELLAALGSVAPRQLVELSVGSSRRLPRAARPVCSHWALLA